MREKSFSAKISAAVEKFGFNKFVLRQTHTLSTSEWYTTIDKLGKLALYLKLYRRYIYWPDGRREGLKKFPDTPVPFHEDIWTNCSLVNDEIQSFVVCFDEFFARKIFVF